MSPTLIHQSFSKSYENGHIKMCDNSNRVTISEKEFVAKKNEILMERHRLSEQLSTFGEFIRGVESRICNMI